MNKKYLPPLVCGFAASVLSTVPGIKNFSCCLIIPAASLFTLLLYTKTNFIDEKILLSKALWLGLFTGLFAAIFSTMFEMLITFFARTNDLIESLPEIELTIKQMNLGIVANDSLKLLKKVSSEINNTGFSSVYLIMILTNNLIVNSIFGMIGGLLGMSYINRKYKNGVQ